ncbi:hypothetical protein GOARA_048_00170 [Gordonia araii NBRC 100433]|uniref:VOC domain-containing protein n=1 Tax=Gordonia araii NBRC 100433 TaxID=1073574 RepID=G7H1U0_9ACTN|nr:VOC family protein [Gordonia araii]NNG97150.1 VOC family protein [Gordonia araii NBRC 100433]GAB09815.1 hypothetical protein GOARA_048_00170 [Gordonia araii NBRC 100433]
MIIHHSVNYVELPAPDLAAAKSFYGAAFGWSFADYGPPGAPAYVGFKSRPGDDEDGGFTPEAEPRGAGGPLILLYSDDLDATVTAVQDAGGTILQDPYEFPGGRRFHFADPAGNELGVWSSS